MVTRPLHAVLLPPDRMLDPLAAALDGSGPAILPLDPALPAGRLRRLLDELAPDAVLTADGPARPGRSRLHQSRLGRSKLGRSKLGTAEDIAVVIATSGSTGQQKGVELSAAALLGSARASLHRIGAVPGDRWLCCLPVSYIAGVQVLIRSLVAGSTPVVVDRLSPGIAAAADGAHVSMVPTQLHRLVEAGASLSSFGIILVGGASVAPALIAGARAAGGRVVVTYGMTETCGGCVYDGEPLDGVRVAIGEGGLVRISGAVLFSSYRRQPGLTAAVLDNGWFTTSDLGSIDTSGRLVIRGRADDVINTGGQKVAGGEVAAVLEACDSVRQAVVVGRPDPEWGERVTAIVVPADPAAPPDLALLRAHVRRALPAGAAPRELVVVGEIPLLPSGKPDVRALRHDGPEAVDVPGTIVASERYY